MVSAFLRANSKGLNIVRNVCVRARVQLLRAHVCFKIYYSFSVADMSQQGRVQGANILMNI